MKKISMFLLVGLALVALAGPVLADTTNTVTNAIGQVITYIDSAEGRRVASIAGNDTTATVETRSKIALVGIQLDTNLTASGSCALHNFSARDIGDILIGLDSNLVYVATEAGTNGWKQVSN